MSVSVNRISQEPRVQWCATTCLHTSKPSSLQPIPSYIHKKKSGCAQILYWDSLYHALSHPEHTQALSRPALAGTVITTLLCGGPLKSGEFNPLIHQLIRNIWNYTFPFPKTCSCTITFRSITVRGVQWAGMLTKQVTCQWGGSKWDVKPSERMADEHS